VLSTDTDHQ